MITKLAAVGAAAIAGAAFFAPVSAAASVPEASVVSPGHAPPKGAVCTEQMSFGEACWVADGDNMWVGDLSADGHRTVAVWRSGGLSGECSNVEGNGHWLYCDYHLPENQDITFHINLQEGADILETSPAVTATT